MRCPAILASATLLILVWIQSAGAFEQIPGADGCPFASCSKYKYKWALFTASTKNYEYAGTFASYQECKEFGERNAAHYSVDGPMYECRLAVKDH
jgi:hypothetical protein